MILKHINYSENKGKPNSWEINDVSLSKQNLIVGVNATGKSRLLNVIVGFAATLSSKVKHIDGDWDLIFGNGGGLFYHYYLCIENGLVSKEVIVENDEKYLLKRNLHSAEIYSVINEQNDSFSPPQDEITVNVRRDTEHYPFLEYFIDWAKNLKMYSFSQTLKNNITIPNNQDGFLDSLTTIPYIVSSYTSNNPEMIDAIVSDMNSIGYSVDKVYAKALLSQGPVNTLAVVLKERDLSCETEQINISDGMFRALCVIGILEFILFTGKKGTIIIDDLGEGLDFERSSKLIKLLFDKTQDSEIQLIITSNDRFLINSVDMKNINYLIRHSQSVEALNYLNSKVLFDNSILAGLNNFDLITR